MKNLRKLCGVCNDKCKKHVYHFYHPSGDVLTICAKNRKQAIHKNPEPDYFPNKSIRRSKTLN